MKKLLLPEGMARADRTEFLNTRMRSIVPEICVERARLVTESYRDGRPYSSWFTFNLWAAANGMEAIMDLLAEEWP